MLLICPRCQNTYTFDDQAYAQQGAMCQNCMEPLVPCQDGNYAQNAQWGNDAQWGNQPQYQQNDAQWGNQPQYQNDAQWGNQPQYQNDAQWGNQPQYQNDAQWGNQPQYQNDAQWGNQPQYQNDAQWGNQPQYQDDAQWGNQPQYQDDAQWGNSSQGPSDAQWGNQPQAQMPAATPAPQAYAGSERTVALDLDEFNANADFDQLSEGHGPSPIASDDGWSNNPPTEVGNAHETVALLDSIQPRPSGQIVVGSQSPEVSSAGMTRQIDLKDVEDMYGDKGTFARNFIPSINIKYFIIAGAAAAVAIIIFIVVLIIANKEEKPDLDIAKDGSIIVAGTQQEEPLTFKEIADATKSSIAGITIFEGNNVSEGFIVGASENTGIILNNKKLVSLSELSNGDLFNDTVFKYAEDNKSSDIRQPFILLLDETLPISVAYRLMYTLAPTRHPILLGGITPNGNVTTIEIAPYEWPEHDHFIYSMEATPNTSLKITRKDITLRRTTENADPLSIKEDGTAMTELVDEIRAGKLIFDNINPALAKFRQTGQSSLLIESDGDITISTFLNVALKIQGDPNIPNVKKLLLKEVPLR